MEQSRFDNVTVMKYYADWCQPCRVYARTFHKVTNDLKVNTQEINIDNEPELAQLYGVVTIPQTVVLKEGREVARKIGAIRGSELTELIEGAAR